MTLCLQHSHMVRNSRLFAAELAVSIVRQEYFHCLCWSGSSLACTQQLHQKRKPSRTRNDMEGNMGL
jgi:hypothetical protein